MQTLLRLGLTIAALVIVALFVTLISADVSIEAFDEPGTPGKFGVQFALCFALGLGWAFGAGIEQMWRDERRDLVEAFQELALAVVSRLTLGIFLFFVVSGVEFGFEALGLGLGAS